MNHDVPVVRAGKVGQRRLVGGDALLHRRVADGVHGDLQARTVGGDGKGVDLLLGVVEHAAVIRVVGIRRKQCRILGAEAAVQRQFKTAADALHPAFQHLGNIHGLEEDAEGLRQAALQHAQHVHVHIARIAHAFDGVYQADACGGQRSGALAQAADDAQGAELGRNLVHAVVKGALVQPAVRMKAGVIRHLGTEKGHHGGVAHRRMPVIFDDDERSRHPAVQVLAVGQTALPHQMAACAEADEQLFPRVRFGVGADDGGRLVEAVRVGDVEGVLKCGEALKVHVRIAKGRDRHRAAQVDARHGGVFSGQIVPQPQDAAVCSRSHFGKDLTLGLTGDKTGIFENRHGTTSFFVRQ